MKDGEIGLYKNDEGVIYAHIRKGDKGIAFDELLIEEMRGDGFDQAPVGGYTQMVYLYLTTSEQWGAWTQGAEKQIAKSSDQKTKLQTPPLDLHALGLLAPDRSINYQRLRELFQLVGPHYQVKPLIGLVPEMIKRGHSDNEIRKILGFHARHGGEMPKGFDQYFTNIFIPPDFDAANKTISQEKIEYALSWCRRPSDEAELKQDNLYWNLNFQELGITHSDGTLDYTLANHARDFIWQDESQEPDYFVLREHLKQFLPKPLLKKAAVELPKAYRDKLKKQKRKMGKLKRRKK